MNIEKALMGIDPSTSDDDISSVIVRSFDDVLPVNVFGDEIRPLIVSGGVMIVSIIVEKKLDIIAGIPHLYLESFCLAQNWDSGGCYLDPQDFVLDTSEGDNHE